MHIQRQKHLYLCRWGKYIYLKARRDAQKHKRWVVYPCRPTVQWWLAHQLQQKCLTENWPQGDIRCEHGSSARLQEKIHSFNQSPLGYFIFKMVKTHRQGLVFICTFAGCVQQGSLKRDNLHVVQVFIDGHLNCKPGVWVHIRKGQQVCGAHKEVSMERVDGKTCRGTQWEKKWSLPKSCTSHEGLELSWAVGPSHLCCSVFSWQPQSRSFWLDIFSDPSGNTPPEWGYAGGGRRGSGRRFPQRIWIYSLQETSWRQQSEMFPNLNLKQCTLK